MADGLLSARVARSIRAVLADERLTQEWLAEASGIPMRTLARRLHVRQPSAMSIEELARISAALDVDIADLLDESRLSARRLGSRLHPPT
ncbi:helix-turn-helix transcriptional regulator [Microbacterium sp. H37-C3]|uniref:helix-turn-helix domain-containing protein n=1 Tax=Microbacterium sp. H37-C3 TaxID=3004354 RepID=UPI0022B04467|nr:helix-turn-helix transcriptional regulator [Microbacterium sp. H37-C3]MCZ4067849.1 helix-turn-helix transcriptional regulator [Microbacterium sp. H37-C3]